MLHQQILIVDDEIFNVIAAKCVFDCEFKIKNIDDVCKYALNGLRAYEEVVANVEKNGVCTYDLILMDG
jgi:hypothetical protein